MDAFGVRRAAFPSRPSDAELRLSLRLIGEEYKEVRVELLALLREERADEVQARLGLLLKELADLRYVVEHTALLAGMDIDGAFAEVHRSNMSKLGPDGLPLKDASGKVQKGPDYVPADMTPFVPNIIEGSHEED